MNFIKSITVIIVNKEQYFSFFTLGLNNTICHF